MKQEDQLLKAILRQDFASFIHKTFSIINPGSEFIPNWHINLIAEYLEAVRRLQIKRLIINMPPRALKSICVNVAWPAWLLGHNPASRIMTASYSQVLSIKHSLDTRFVLSNPEYQRLFSNTKLSKDQNQKSKFMTTKYGFRFATSIGGSATGEGGDVLIIDDPHNPTTIHSQKARTKVVNWYEQTFSTRLNSRDKGAIVLTMQRLHEDDLAGHLINNHIHEWAVLKIPSIAYTKSVFDFGNIQYTMQEGEVLNKTRDSKETIEQLIGEIGQQNFAAQYQQEPLIANNKIIDPKTLHYYDKLPCYSFTIQSWDTAIKVNDNAAFSVCTTWGEYNNKYYLIDCFHQQIEYPKLKKQVTYLINQYQPRLVLIEDKASGQSLIQDLVAEGIRNIVAIRPSIDKVSRLATCAELISSGKVFFPQVSSWKNFLLDQLLRFPNGSHDDIVDSISQFLNYIKYQEMRKNPQIRLL